MIKLGYLLVMHSYVAIVTKRGIQVGIRIRDLDLQFGWRSSSEVRLEVPEAGLKQSWAGTGGWGISYGLRPDVQV
jgi:hypothetical protein